MNKSALLLLVVIAAIVSLSVVMADTTPYDAERSNIVGNLSRTMVTDQSVVAYGGNISSFNLSLEVQTPYWVGYFGSVTHSTSLADDSSNTFYDWGSTASTGYVMLSSSVTVDWASLIAGVGGHATAEDTALGLTGLAESVANTFTTSNTAVVNISGSDIGATTALAVNTTSNGGSEWQTILTFDGVDRVYVGPIQQDNENYAGNPADFQVLVPVDGTTHSRTYYLYMAIN